MKKRSNEQIAMGAARNSILINIALAALKLFAGIFAHSAAMVSDAAHSIVDLISTAIAMIGVKLSGKKPDKEHPYGHERFECVAALLLSGLIFVTGVGIGWAGIQRIIAGEATDTPGVLALVVAAVSIGVKEGVYWYMIRVAKKVDSSALAADAWHSRIDGLSSIGSFIGILGARMGFPVLDSVAAIVIGLFIIKAAVKIFWDTTGKLTDRACDDETVNQMRTVILADEAVDGIDQLKTRMFGNKIYLDLEICANPQLTLAEAHDIAQRVHDAIEAGFPKVKHCMVHVNPSEG